MGMSPLISISKSNSVIVYLLFYNKETLNILSKMRTVSNITMTMANSGPLSFRHAEMFERTNAVFLNGSKHFVSV